MFIFQKNVLCLPQNLHDRIIMLRIMREGAARAILDPSAIFLEIPGIPGAVLQAVHGAVAEQAVELRPLRHRVAGVIFALLVGIESEVLALPVFFLFAHNRISFPLRQFSFVSQGVNRQ